MMQCMILFYQYLIVNKINVMNISKFFISYFKRNFKAFEKSLFQFFCSFYQFCKYHRNILERYIIDSNEYLC